MKTTPLKSSLMILPLALAAGMLTGCVHENALTCPPKVGGGPGTTTQVVTPVLGSAGPGSCFGSAVAYAYDNPSNPKTPLAITNWPAGGNCLTLTLTPTAPANNAYVLQPALTWTKPGIPPIPEPPLCSGTSSQPNGSVTWTYTWSYVPTQVIPEVLVMSHNSATPLGSISFTYNITSITNTP